MYILFYTAMTKSQAYTVVITNIDSAKYEKLYAEHGELLSCPCSTITASYKTFVSNTIQFHPICSSFFVTQQWIDALYLPNRSSYGVVNFRTAASSQVNFIEYHRNENISVLFFSIV